MFRSEEEIDTMISRAIDLSDEGGKFPAMTYEQGVEAALRWAKGEEDDPLE